MRTRVLEALMIASIVGVGITVYLKAETTTYYLLVLAVLFYICKLVAGAQLRKREFLSNIVEQRTMELRFQRDEIQAESQKLSQALTALAEAQDELVRKERLASIGQLTQGLVDRILNPLNYINNFADLSIPLATEIKGNIEEDKSNGDYANFEDTEELLTMLCTNLDKISKHGGSTVRIMKAMEELLRDRSGIHAPVEVNELCRVNLDKFKKNYAREIEDKKVSVTMNGLSTSLTMDLDIEQMGKMLQHIFNNSMYAVIKKQGAEDYAPEISLNLRILGDKLQIVIRDNGIGIEASIIEKVFSPFFTTKTTAEAVGTGLYLSREVVLNHKGTIALTSEKNEYTEVTIALPLYQ